MKYDIALSIFIISSVVVIIVFSTITAYQLGIQKGKILQRAFFKDIIRKDKHELNMDLDQVYFHLFEEKI